MRLRPKYRYGNLPQDASDDKEENRKFSSFSIAKYFNCMYV